MRGFYPFVSDHEHRMTRDDLHRSRKSADHYRDKYLELRKMLREYARETGAELPEEIEKAIGIKRKIKNS